MQATKPRILTARLNLTRINKEHEGALSAILSDPEVMYAWEHGFSAADCREWFAGSTPVTRRGRKDCLP